MNDVEDGIGPILQKIQVELAAIKGKLEEHHTRFDGIDRRFDGIDRQLAQSRAQVVHAYGLSAEARTASLVNDGVEDLERRLEGLAARVDALESQ